MSTIIRASAPAKVNLVFEVGQLASDGYHPVNSLFLALDLREELALVKGEPGTGISIYVHGDSIPEAHINAVPVDSSNLVHKTAVLFAMKLNKATPDLQIDIHKRIPVAGGMAGGSADAAAMLVAMNEFMHQEHGTDKLSISELAVIGAELGSDVPFCIYGGMAIGTGRGEIITPLEDLSFETNWLLCASHKGLSTPTVFSAFDELDVETKFTDLSDLPNTSSAEELGSRMTNDLEQAAFSLMPSLSQQVQELEELGAIRAMVSGSGPTIAALFESEAKAIEVSKVLKSKGLVALTAKGGAQGSRLDG
jgi:4-diphosphocytidyl-2-C-methyl-D-erythritol kinase